MYAIVDIETTGSSAVDNRIIEIAVVVYNGKKIVKKYQSLINPERNIPRFITGLTGISDEMVATAPKFEEVAKDVYKLLHNKIFVAHNVNFDHSFVRKELAEAGKVLNTQKLCTVRLSRKILPGLPSYSLSQLCNSLNITHTDKHRALGDTNATVQLFEILLKKDSQNFIQQSLKKNSREAILPPHLNKEKFTSLPNKAGVYYFHDNKGKIIYIGKAKDLKKRVSSHFTSGSKTRAKSGLINNIHDVTYKLCGNELVALLLETSEIKKYWPAYNYALKNPESVYGIYEYHDRKGFLHLGINKAKKINTALITFPNLIDARNFLLEKIKEHFLCLKMCGMQKAAGPCLNHDNGICNGACLNEEAHDTYNTRVHNFINSLKNEPAFAIIGEGREEHEASVVVTKKGQCIGYGYADKKSLDYNDSTSFLKNVFPYSNYSYTNRLLLSMLGKEEHEEIIYIDEETVDLNFTAFKETTLNLWSGN